MHQQMRFATILAVVFLCHEAHAFLSHRKSTPFLNDSLHTINEHISRSTIGKIKSVGPRCAKKQARVDDANANDAFKKKPRDKVDRLKDSDEDFDDEDNDINVYSDESGTYKAGELLPVEVVKRWLDEGTLKKIPSNVFDLNSRDRTVQAKGDNERQEFFLGTFTELIEDPSNMKPPKGKDEYRYRNGRVEVRAAASRHGSVRYHLPTVYFCHKNGFIVACRIKVGKLTKMKMESIAARKTEVLGKVNDIHCTISYSILAAQVESQQGYLAVKLATELCNKSMKPCFVHNLCLVTFKGARPPGHVSRHIGDVSDNSVEKLDWIPIGEMLKNRNIKKKRQTRYTVSTFHRDKTYYSSGLHDWWANVRYPHLLLSGDCTHVYHTKRKRYIQIQKRTHRKTGKVTFCMLSFFEGTAKWVDYCQFAVEAFIGDKLSSGAIFDDVDEYHENHNYENPNTEKKNYQGEREDGSILGVYRKHVNRKKKYDVAWVVVLRIPTPGGPTDSIIATKRFSIKEHGYEKARQLAMDYRNKYTLKAGMKYECVRVAPTVRKSSG